MDLGAEFDAAFDVAIEHDVAESGYPVSEWYWNGPAAPETAVTQWRERGPRLAERFVSWYEGSGYRIWITPDGRPAIELHLTVMFGKVPVTMYVDAILVNEYGLTVLDFKTGAGRPHSMRQLGVYASGVELAYGIRPLFGSYYMARGIGKRGTPEDELTYFLPPRPLTAPYLSVEHFTRQFEAMQRGIDAEAYVANVGKHCDRCPVRAHCEAVTNP